MTPSTGLASVDISVEDLSIIASPAFKGVAAVLGKTERGPVNKTVLVGSWPEYRKFFGGLLTDSDFPLYCQRALAAGARLRIGRVNHYTDIDDKTTLQGTVASLTITGTTPAIFSAENIGSWGNGLRLTVAAAADGTSGQWDVTLSLIGYPELNKVTRNLPTVLTAEAIAKFNAENQLAKITSAAGTELAAATLAAFTGGVEDREDVVAADYVGSETAETGLHKFDNSADFVRIAVPELAINAVDNALANYAKQRRDCRAILRTPLYINGDTALDYRNATGLYSGVKVDTWFASMVYGTILITDPITGATEKGISPIGDYLGAGGRKDNNSYEWFTTAGPARGLVYNTLGLNYNLGTPARATEAAQVANAGLNPVIDDATYGRVIWGAQTLQVANTLLNSEDVAELLIYISRAIMPLVRSELFNPNDIDTWKAIWRKVDPILLTVKQKRGLWDYLYQGDQFIDNIADAVVNSPDDVDAGRYTARIFLKPKRHLKWIGISLTVVNSGVDFDVLAGEP